MKFCPNCEFKFYQTETPEGLVWQCKNCGTLEKSDEVVIFRNIYKGTEIDNLNVNDIVYDPSYPRSNKFKCPNQNCMTLNPKKKKKQECIFLTGDNMKKIYICTTCKTQWGY